MKNTSQGYPRNYTANTTGDILQAAEKIYFMAKVSTTPFSLGIYRIRAHPINQGENSLIL